MAGEISIRYNQTVMNKTASAVASHSASPQSTRTSIDQHFVVYGVSWADYTLLRDTLEIPGLRMTYLDGTLELMSPSKNHEVWKTTIARLVEVYALERDIPLYGYGSMTFRKEAEEAGAEPDECYTVGAQMPDEPEREAPDVVLEVIVTHGSVDKLAVYERLGAREVWFFEKGAFHVYSRTDDGFVAAEQSHFLPALDLSVVAQYATRPDQHEAVVEFQSWLREGR